MEFYNTVRKKVMYELKKGENNFIIFPFGEVGKMIEGIILQTGKQCHILRADNNKTDSTVISFDEMLSSKYQAYKILLAIFGEETHKELLIQLNNEKIDKNRIVDFCICQDDKEKTIYEDVDFWGRIDPRRGMLERCAREIYYRNVPGQCAEAGVFRGDFAKHINYWFPDRELYLIDTFEGFDDRDVEYDESNTLSKSPETAWEDTSELIVLGKMPNKQMCKLIKGWFPDSVRDLECTYAFVSLDMDLYQPILEGLRYFYPRLNHGGYIMVHDCCNDFYKGARKALDDFCKEEGISYVICSDVYGSGVLTK
ncbi:MAG: TylF/MycF family methyltransferase [Pseudobutyrivibrio sp.]|nr:TylF/MycF family methyltransferase [Pseudobutyrivibrio sp.]